MSIIFTNEVTSSISSYIMNFNSLFYNFVNKMVQPCFSDEIETACVQFHKDDYNLCIKFLINQNFWNSLNYNEKCFLFTHESLHVIFNHGYNGNKFIESLNKENRSYQLLNVAMDICINHIIMDSFMKSIPLISMPFIKEGCFIETIFKKEDINSIERGRSFEYYYMKYLELYGKDIDKLTLDEHDFNIENGNEVLGEITPKEIRDEINKLLNNESCDSDNKNSFEEILNNITQKNENKENDYFIDKGNKREINIKIDKKYDLSSLLKLCLSKKSVNVKNKKSKYIWHGTNRRIDSILKNSNLIVPTVGKHKNEHDKSRVCVFLDFSDSCENYSNKFFNLINNLPKNKYEIKLFFFASEVQEFVLNKSNLKNVLFDIGYGTNIRSVINKIDEMRKIGKLFDYTFILTDGQYEDISHMEYKNCIFFLTEDSFKGNIFKGSKYFLLKNKRSNHVV